MMSDYEQLAKALDDAINARRRHRWRRGQWFTTVFLSPARFSIDETLHIPKGVAVCGGEVR